MNAEKNSLPAGEQPFKDGPAYERPEPFRLLSGKLFRREEKDYAVTSDDDGKTWTRGGRINPYHIGQCLRDVDIQIQKGPHKGRLLAPYYLEMDGAHPDYTREQRGGYAIWRGRTIPLETHTHVPEMAGSFICYSDDDGLTWQTSKGFLMGYFNDGHLGHWSCEEPVVAELKDGRILCFMRSTCGCILKSYSSDGGETWTKVETTDLAMSNSPCALCRLPGTGDLVLVWNPMSADEIRRGYRRGRLSLALSKDDGRTWQGVRALELCPGLEEVECVKPPAELTPMVRGGSGPDEVLGELPDGFRHCHYPNIFVVEDEIAVGYKVTFPAGEGRIRHRWRRFAISRLYEA